MAGRSRVRPKKQSCLDSAHRRRGGGVVAPTAPAEFARWREQCSARCAREVYAQHFCRIHIALLSNDVVGKSCLRGGECFGRQIFFSHPRISDSICSATVLVSVCYTLVGRRAGAKRLGILHSGRHSLLLMSPGNVGNRFGCSRKGDSNCRLRA